MEGVLRAGMVGLTVALAVTLLVHHLVIARRPGGPPLRTTLARAAPLILLSLAMLCLIILSEIGTPQELRGGGAMQLDWFSGLGIASDPVGTPDMSTEAMPGLQDNDSARTQPAPRSLLPLLAALLIIGGLLAAMRRWRPGRRKPVPLAPFPLQDEEADYVRPERVRVGLRESIEAMLVDPDPRTAVIGAYARLLETLDHGPGARLPFEAPREHLRRAMALHDFPVDASRVLIEQFELARYSRHPLNETHRSSALTALRAVLAALEAHDRGRGAASPRAGQW